MTCRAYALESSVTNVAWGPSFPFPFLFSCLSNPSFLPCLLHSVAKRNFFKVYFKDFVLLRVSLSAFLMIKSLQIQRLRRKTDFFPLKNLGAPGLCPSRNVAIMPLMLDLKHARESTVTRYTVFKL